MTSESVPARTQDAAHATTTAGADARAATGPEAWLLRGVMLSITFALGIWVLWTGFLVAKSMSVSGGEASDVGGLLLGAASALVFTLPVGGLVGFLLLLPVDRALRPHPSPGVRRAALAGAGAAAAGLFLVWLAWQGAFDGGGAVGPVLVVVLLAGTAALAGLLADRGWAQRRVPVLVLLGVVLAIGAVGLFWQYS